MIRAFLVIALFLVALGAEAPLGDLRPTNGLAILYIDPPDAGSLSLAATLSLPNRPENSKWYATWIMILASGDRNTVPFLQCGLIRWRGSHFAAVPFIAYRDRNGYFSFRQVGPSVGDKAVQQQIRFSQGFLTVKFGRRLQLLKAASDFFSIGQYIYFQAGDEVAIYGDHLSGTLGELWVEGDHAKRQRPTIVCRYADSGLHLSMAKDLWVGSGMLRDNGPHHEAIEAPTKC